MKGTFGLNYIVHYIFLMTFSSFHFDNQYLSDVGRGLSVTLPASSSSYLVTGLRLGRRYQFTIQPTFIGGISDETFLDERTGKMLLHTLKVPRSR